MSKQPDAQEILKNLNGPMTAEQARAIFALGEEAVVFSLLKLSAQPATPAVLGPHDPSCSSGPKPPFAKENQSDKRRKKKKRVISLTKAGSSAMMRMT